MRCQICGAEMSDSNKFCLACGAKLVKEDSPAAVAPQATATAPPWASAPPAPAADAPQPAAAPPWASAPAESQPVAAAPSRPVEPAPGVEPAAAVQPQTAPASQAIPATPAPTAPSQPAAAAATGATGTAAKSDAFWGSATPAQSNAAYQPGAAPQPHFFDDNDAPVVSVGHWLYTLLLWILVPVAAVILAVFLGRVIGNQLVGNILLLVAYCSGLILMFVWAFNRRTNPSKKNFFRAVLIVTAILIVVIIVLWIIFGSIIMYYYNDMWNMMQQYSYLYN